MKMRLLRGLAAVTLSVAVVVPGAAPPARADEGSDQVLDLTVTVAQSLVSKSPGGYTAAEIAELVLQVVTKVNASRDHVITTIENLAIADNLAGARNSLRTVNYLERSQTTVENYVLEVGFLADDAAYTMGALSNGAQAQIDAVGAAMMSLYTIAMGGYPKVGLETGELVNHYRSSLQTFIDKMRPECGTYLTDEPPPGPGSRYVCEAYDGTISETKEKLFPDGWWVSVNGTGWVKGRITDVERFKTQDASMRNTNEMAAILTLQALAPL